MPFINRGVEWVCHRLGKSKLKIFDVFSGSGVVARSFKSRSSFLLVNDLELYSKIINTCYLTNKSTLDMTVLKDKYKTLLASCKENLLKKGLIASLYAPKVDSAIEKEERVFYTNRNAKYIDTMREAIDKIEDKYKPYFLAPLLYEASVHSNTSGVFKGFYKNKKTRIGQFGGTGEDALKRIKGQIVLPFPVFSNFECEYKVYQEDANTLIKRVPEVDLAYLDPPYNQHPYGSNYFMLNLIAKNSLPEKISRVSGIVQGWNHSSYNKKKEALNSLSNLVTNLRASYILISYNSEGFIRLEEMQRMLNKIGKLKVLETRYNTFRASRNLKNRAVHTTEYLFLLEK